MSAAGIGGLTLKMAKVCDVAKRSVRPSAWRKKSLMAFSGKLRGVNI
jgi:hypothetical protein